MNEDLQTESNEDFDETTQEYLVEGTFCYYVEAYNEEDAIKKFWDLVEKNEVDIADALCNSAEVKE